VFNIVGKIQEFSLPLLVGLAVALVMANAFPDTYTYMFGAEVAGAADAQHHRRLTAMEFQPLESTAHQWSKSGDVISFAGTGVPGYYPYNIAYYGSDVTDGELEVKVNFTGRSAGILMRVATGSYYMCGLDSRVGHGLEVVKGWADMGEPRLKPLSGRAAEPDEQNADIVLKMSVSGSRIDCFKDGVLKATADDDSFSQGQLGFATADASATFIVLSAPTGGICQGCLKASAGHGESVGRFLISDCPIFGHAWTLHFFANDVIMVFFFGLAAKEITEAALPGGSLNPPSKAGNPLFATLGGVIGPIVTYIVFLEVFHAAGWFGEGTGEDHWDKALLYKGWGIVTATDISLAWLCARLIFGSGHPAIDYLLLLAVVDDAIGLVIIAVFYPDPNHPVEPIYLLLVLAGMVVAFLLRRWHILTHKEKIQSWIPYVVLGGSLSWVGLVMARAHPALALIPIVPFMPGPEPHQLDSLNKENDSELEDLVNRHLTALTSNPEEATQAPSDDPPAQSLVRESSVLHEQSVRQELSRHLSYAGGRGREITAGRHASIIGNRIDPALKTTVQNEDGEKHSHACTLDNFEQSVKVYVDFGMFLFAVCNAGVEIRGLGSMTILIVLSLVVGKVSGIFLFSKLAQKVFGLPPPLGVGNRHMLMIALLGSIGLTVALFVSDVAFEDPFLKGDAKLGALLSGLVCPVAILIGRFAGFTHENDIHETVKQQVGLLDTLHEAEILDTDTSSDGDSGL